MSDCDSEGGGSIPLIHPFSRICPLCKRLLTYASKLSLWKANKNGRPCRKCVESKLYAKDILNDKRKRAGVTLRRCLLDSGRELKCEGCGLSDKWQGKQITLEVDHIDGDNTHNNITNLRFLCPNCHSQTETFGFRNRKHSEETRKLISEKVRASRILTHSHGPVV